MFRAPVLAVLFAVASLASAADVGCDIGLYSQYVGATGGVAGKDREPAVQGSCKWSFSGPYLEVWGSQSTKNPGLGTTYANEIDLTVGYDKKFSDRWSGNVHFTYADLANDRLFQSLNGDLLNVGGTARYQITADTRLYANLEGYHGLGERGLPGGWRVGFGMRTLLGPMVVDGTLFHNQNFLGHGQFLKVMLEPKAPMTKFAGGEVRPTLFLYKPIGKYGDYYGSHAVVAVHVTW